MLIFHNTKCLLLESFLDSNNNQF
uniref:Uncharacterized protein n=1 Tax=Rhizophora mucronata TaxID=61149 RepID=A0A2P2P4E4_RHIMU